MKNLNIIYNRTLKFIAVSVVLCCCLATINNSNAQGLINSGAIIKISSGTTMNISGGSSGNFTNQDYSTYTGTVENDGTIEVQGNWTNNSASKVFTASTGSVNLSGTSQTIGGTDSTYFNNLSFTGAGTKTLNVNTWVGGGFGSPAGVLSLGSSILDLNSHLLTVKNPLPGGVVPGSGYIVSETPSPNYGSITWQMNGATVGAYVFPFGNASSGNYLPVTVNVTTTGSGSSSSLTMSTYPTTTSVTPNNRPLPTGVTNLAGATVAENANKTVDRFWMIDNSGFTTLPVYNLTLTYRESEWDATGGSTNSITESTLKAQGWSTKWQPTQLGAVNTTANTVTVTGANAYSNYKVWALASSLSPLPVELISFDATCHGEKGVYINWKTTTEQNVSDYIVQRSNDGIYYNTIGTLSAQNNSNGLTSYDWYDDEPLDAVSYYRLAANDFNGSATVFNAVSVKKCNEDEKFQSNIYSSGSTVYYNIGSDNKGNCSINIFDASGKLLRTDIKSIDVGINSFEFNYHGLSKGIYFVKVITQIGNISHKFIIQ